MKLKIAALALLLAVSPLAVADWGAKGIHEPQTTHDVNDGLMFLAPDTSPDQAIEKVYFAAIQGYNVPPNEPTAWSPNLAILGTEHLMTPYQAYALLGAWKDCNNDGFIGDGDNALFEYRTTLLDATVGENTCPKANSLPWGAWNPISFEQHEYQGLIHNDGTWVHEFIPIGYDAWAGIGQKGTNTNPFKIVDLGARVWGDNGLPGASTGGRCWISPTPPGTFHTVGAIEDYADCFNGNTVASNVHYVTGQSPTIASEYAALRAMENPWGDQSQPSDVVAFDCSKPIVSEPTPEVTKVTVNQPIVPPHVSTSGSVGGTVNETAYDTTTCNRGSDPNPSDNQEALANLPYSHESGAVSASVPGIRTETDQSFTFNQGTRAYAQPGVNNALGPGAMTDAGLNIDGAYGVWIGNNLCTNCQQYFTRQAVGDVSNPHAPVSLGVQQQTFYAYVSPTAIAQYGLWLPGGSPGVAPGARTFGAEACGTATSGVTNGWDCNPADWYHNIDGSSSATRDVNDGLGPDGKGAIMSAYPGSPYNLRAVNCYDESVEIWETPVVGGPVPVAPGGKVGRDTQVAGAYPLDVQGTASGTHCV